MAYSPRPEPEFESPYRPPAGFIDLLADIEQDSGYPYSEVVGNQLFRFHRAAPKALAVLVTAQSEYNTNNAQRLQQTLKFITMHTHPDDIGRMMVRLVDDDDFGIDQLDELTRAIAKAGTARPIPPSSPWQRRRRRIGAKYGRA